MFCGNFLNIFCFTVLTVINFSFGKKSADHYFDICHRNDPDLNRCIEKAIMSAKPNLMKGIPEINLPPFEPLYLSKYDFKEGTGNFKFVLTLTKANIAGLAKMTIENVRFSGKKDSNITFECTIKAPTIHLYGSYSINGRILVIPVDGKGHLSLNLTQPILKASLQAHSFVNTKDQKKYLMVDALSMDLATKSGRVLLTNLFNGDKTLGRTVNNFFNNNFQDLFGALKHLPEQFFGERFVNAVSIIFNTWPYDELLPQ